MTVDFVCFDIFGLECELWTPKQTNPLNSESESNHTPNKWTRFSSTSISILSLRFPPPLNLPSATLSRPLSPALPLSGASVSRRFSPPTPSRLIQSRYLFFSSIPTLFANRAKHLLILLPNFRIGDILMV